MIIERKNLDSLVDSLVEKGLSKEGAKRIVYGYFNSTMEVLKDGEEIPLLGSENLYQKKEWDHIRIYSFEEKIAEKIDELYARWVRYGEELDKGKDICNEAISLLKESEELRRDYVAHFGEPNILQKIFIDLEPLMYKSVILKPFRKAILERGQKVTYMALLNTLKCLAIKLYDKCSLNCKLKDINNFMKNYLSEEQRKW